MLQLTQATAAEQSRVTQLADLSAFLDDRAGTVYLLRWAATDFAATIFDTESLSATRGASVMADDFPRQVVTRYHRPSQTVDPSVIVYAAASEAVLIFCDMEKALEAGRSLVSTYASYSTAADSDAGSARGAVLFASPSAFAVRAVDLCAGPAGTEAVGNGLVRVLTELATEIAIKRARQLDVRPGATPWALPAASGGDPDPIDRVRLPDDSVDRRVDNHELKRESQSHINAARFRRGQRARLGLTQKLVEVLAANDVPGHWRDLLDHERFLDDLGAIAQSSAAPRVGYIGLLAIDGSGFGRFRNAFLATRGHAGASDAPAGQGQPPAHPSRPTVVDRSALVRLAQYSLVIECAMRRALARAVLPCLVAMADAAAAVAVQAPDGHESQRLAVGLNVQLLVDAGDDSTLIVPGTTTWSVIQGLVSGWPLAAREAADLAGLDSAAANAFAALGVKVGAVVAHHNTPIQHLRVAAVALEGSASSRKQQDRPSSASASAGARSFVDFAVLKSHDVPPDGILQERHRQRIISGDTTRRPMTSDEFDVAFATASALAAARFPARQLKRAVAEALRGRNSRTALSHEATDALDSIGPPAVEPIDRVDLRSNAPTWLDVAEVSELVGGGS